MNEFTHYKSSAVILLIAVGQKCKADRRTCRIMWICFAGYDSGIRFVNSQGLAKFFVSDVNEGHLLDSRIATIGSFETLTPTVIGDWKRFRKEKNLAANRIADEHHYRKHLVASVYRGYFPGIMQSLLNLQFIYHERDEHLKATGCYHYSKYIFNVYKDYVKPDVQDLELFENAISLASDYVRANGSDEILSKVNLIPLAPYRFPNNILQCYDVYLFLWRLDDLNDGSLLTSS